MFSDGCLCSYMWYFLYSLTLMEMIVRILTHTSSLRRLAREAAAMVLSVCCCSAGHVETQSPDIGVFLHGAPPFISWSSPLSPALRCPSEGCSGDGVGGHAHICPNFRHRHVCIISARVSIPASSIAKMWCFAVSVGAVHNDSTVSVVSFDIAGTLKQKVGVALPASAAPQPKGDLTSRESLEVLAADTVGR